MIRRDFIKLTSLVTGSLFVNHSSAAFATDGSDAANGDLYEIFAHPERKYRPFVRWWWNGDRITEEELLRELDVLKAAGIGGVEINPIKFPSEADPMGIPSLTWLSEDWIKVLKSTLEGAKKKNMICDMIVGSGWPYGGEFLSREDQTQIVALGIMNVSGPKQLQISRKELLDCVHPAFGFPYSDPLKELIDVRMVPVQLNDLSQSHTYADQLAHDFITIDVPQGDHVLYCLAKITGFMAVINGAPGASGPVLNHYDAGAVDRYLNHLSDKLKVHLGPLGNHFRAFFTDSIELEGANWCDDMLAQFHQRRGYDLSPWLPFILFKVGEMGNAVSGNYGAAISPELKHQIELVRFDFETTKHELFQERFIKTFAAWCTKEGVKSRMQAYGMDCDPIASGMLLDIPECETWLRSEQVQEFGSGSYTQGRSYTMINKFVSSSAHLAGKKLISAEDMTNTDDPFHTSLERLKLGSDQSMLSGVTHSVLHGFNYSPLDAPFPGWVRYGTYFSERNPWWPYFNLWTDYKARLSALLQHAEMQAEIAILLPMADLAKKYGFQRDPFPRVAYPSYVHKVWEAVHQNGNGCDYLSEEVIQKSSIKNGQLVFNTRSYKAILLPEVESLAPATARVLQQFADAGGKLLFIEKAPHHADSLVDNAAQSKTVDQIFTEILKKHPNTAAIVPIHEQNMVEWYRDLQQKYNLQSPVKISKPTDYMSQLHYKVGDRDIFFFMNYGPKQTNTFDAIFDVGDKLPWLWNPETGERFLYKPVERNNKLTITLAPSESRLIVFEPKSASSDTAKSISPSASIQETLNTATAKVSLSGPWQLSLNHANGTFQNRELKELEDFCQDEELKSFAGVVIYRNHFRIENTNARFWLDLGRPNGVSEVEVNGVFVGVRWYGDHLYEISDAVRSGENQLSIKLVTTLGNYMKTLKHNKAAEAWTSDTPFISMGIPGPVTLLTGDPRMRSAARVS